MVADTVAKLLYEWSRPDRAPGSPWDISPRTTLIVDEAGMLATSDLHTLTRLADTHEWRLVLVGDPRQLQAVARGGLFNELCTTGRTVALETVHRFTYDWEAGASLRIRHGDPRGLDAYEAHGRIIPGTFAEHLERIVDSWIRNHAAGKTVAVTTTNSHVDKVNEVIQQHRLQRGDVNPARCVEIADGAYAHEGDIVATRRNHRQLHTTAGDTVRTRDLLTVTRAGDTGDLTVSRIDGHGTVTLPADYVREHVRLGYAATEPGNQSGTETSSITLATPATTGRGSYVAITRGQQENQIFVVTDTHDIREARDVLETLETAEAAIQPFDENLRLATIEVARANAGERTAKQQLADAGWRTRKQARTALATSTETAGDARANLAQITAEREPFQQATSAAYKELRRLRDGAGRIIDEWTAIPE